LSRLRSVDGRFGDARSNACREFDAMLAGDHADRVGLVLEPVYQEVEPKLGPDGFASSGDQVVWRFERVLRIARRNALFQAIANVQKHERQARPKTPIEWVSEESARA